MSQQLTVSNVPCSFLVQNEPFKTDFETAVTEAIDDILSSFGNTVKQAIYRQLENRYGINKRRFPLKLKTSPTQLNKPLVQLQNLLK